MCHCKKLRLFVFLLLPLIILGEQCIHGQVQAQAPVTANFELVGQLGGDISAVFVQDNYVYVGEGPRLVVLDVSDPRSIRIVGRTDPLPGLLWDVFVAESTAYAIIQGNLWIIDVGDPSYPTALGFYAMGDKEWSSSVYVSDNIAYVTTESGLTILDVNYPKGPKKIGDYKISSSAHGTDVVVIDHTAYMTSWPGFFVLDVSNPADPQKLKFWDIFLARSVFVVEDKAYVTSDSGLVIVDINSPNPPLIIPGEDKGNMAVYASDHWVVSSQQLGDTMRQPMIPPGSCGQPVVQSGPPGSGFGLQQIPGHRHT